MIFGLGIGLALLIFLLLWKQENERIAFCFEGEAVTTGAEFQEMLDRHMHALDSARTSCSPRSLWSDTNSDLQQASCVRP